MFFYFIRNVIAKARIVRYNSDTKRRNEVFL